MGCVAFTVGENMRLVVVGELQNGVVHPAGHYSLIDNTTGCDTLAFGLCLLTRRLGHISGFPYFPEVCVELLMSSFICVVLSEFVRE